MYCRKKCSLNTGMYKSNNFYARVLLKNNYLVCYNHLGGYPAQCKPRKGGHDSARSQGTPTISYSPRRLEGNGMQDILTIIQSVGFPIAVAIAMFVMLQNEQKAHREESEKLTQTITDLKITFNSAITDQERSITEAINNNTLVIQKLLDKLEGE